MAETAITKKPTKKAGVPAGAEDEATIATMNMDRLSYAKRVGHDKYVAAARRNEDMYLGGGLMWTEADRAARGNKPCIELNHIMPAVNTALGMQLHSRAHMDFQPRGEGADEETASTISKVIRQICDDIEYHWHESQIYEDGQIQQRGFLDIRMDFSDNMNGKVKLDILDPLDCFPDPDSQSYNPKGWNDFTIAKWWSYDLILQTYGQEVAEKVKGLADTWFEGANEYQDRSHFGEDADATGGDIWVKNVGDGSKQLRLYYIIDRQWKKMIREDIVVTATGEKRAASLLTEQQIADAMVDGGFMIKDWVSRIHWHVTCGKTVLFNELSPYDTYTVIPYFPIFRRGRTRGMVDNLVSPNELENKATTNFLEIWTSAANSGWLFWENSLVDMTKDDLEEDGAKNGLVLEVRKGQEPPKRIEAKQIPQGAERLADRAEYAVKTISGMSDSIQGQAGNEISGVAIENKNFQGQMQQGRMIDNLALTRRLAARKILSLVQRYFTKEQVFRIVDPETKKVKEEITINKIDEYGNVLNNITVGTYDVIIGETQTSVSFRQNQFDQTMYMVEKGIPIRPERVVMTSSMAEKHDVAAEIEQDRASAGTNPVEEAKVKTEEAKAVLIEAQTDKAKSETVNLNVKAQYSAIQTAGVIATTPATAALGDSLLLSAGAIDHDAAPIMPEYNGAPVLDQEAASGQLVGLPPNTNPVDPVPSPGPGSPMEGVNEGIETQRIDGLPAGGAI